MAFEHCMWGGQIDLVFDLVYSEAENLDFYFLKQGKVQLPEKRQIIKYVNRPNF